jgi:hypothetical protein
LKFEEGKENSAEKRERTQGSLHDRRSRLEIEIMNPLHHPLTPKDDKDLQSGN